MEKVKYKETKPVREGFIGHSTLDNGIQVRAANLGLSLLGDQEMVDKLLKSIISEVNRKERLRLVKSAHLRRLRRRELQFRGKAKRSEALPVALQMAGEGYSQRQIAAAFDVTQQTISNWLKSHHDQS